MNTAAEWKKVYTEEFNETYAYDGRLGVVCEKGKTVFRLWSPVASQVRLRLFKGSKEESGAYASHTMEKNRHGVWVYSAEGNLHGTYYDYLLEIQEKEYITIDPYAYSASANGKRGMVVDHALASPEGWGEDTSPTRQTEDVIYELHVKEFSWDLSGGFVPEHRGKYLAFCDENTKLFGTDLSTGTDYLKSLGITHVQLMPIFDFASVDETGAEDRFNWGYDPQNYFVPEGSYASDPFDGNVRVIELKQMIMALHRAGIGVVMDVVFNHTYSFDNALQYTVPWYFYRQYEDGRPSNGSGCGNDIATEKRMCAKLIRDCVLYWAKEYHIDGFRFDLMGLIDTGLMNTIRQDLDEAYGRGNKLIYGEPWAAAQTVIDSHVILSTKDNFAQLDENIGAFSDQIRDVVKGSAWHPRDGGFVNGGRKLEMALYEMMINKKRPASQIISYVSCHDNQTLWDKLTETTSAEELRRREYRLAAAIYMCAPGRIFLLSGEEFLRTKEGYSNTYNAPLYLNRIDWSGVSREAEMVAYYRNLIALRKRLYCLYDKGVRSCHEGIIEFSLLTFCMDNDETREDAPWKSVFFIFNGRQSSVKVALPGGKWDVLCADDRSDLWRERKDTVSGVVMVAAVSAMILGK